ncbi:MAG: PEP-CTERM sorting domain-containing protein, partial [Chlamydiota bacterium]
WGGDYVSSDQSTQRGLDGQVFNFDSFVDLGTNTGVANSYQLNITNAFNPTTGANYSGTSATFYGGLAMSRINSGSLPAAATFTAGVTDNGANDRISFETTTTQNSSVAFGASVFFDKADFLNGGNSLTLSLDQSSATAINSVSVNINTLNAVNTQNGLDARFAFRTATGSFYVADSSLSVGLNTLDSADLAATTFTEMRLVEGTYQGMGGSFLSTVSGDTLTDIDAIGIVAYSPNLGVGQPKTMGFEIDSFEAFAVPEPSSVAMLFFGAGFLAVYRRRK